MFSTVSTALARPSGPVRKPETIVPRFERRVVVSRRHEKTLRDGCRPGPQNEIRAAHPPGMAGSAARRSTGDPARSSAPLSASSARHSATSQPEEHGRLRPAARFDHDAFACGSSIRNASSELPRSIALQPDQAGAEFCRQVVERVSEPKPGNPRPKIAICASPLSCLFFGRLGRPPSGKGLTPISLLQTGKSRPGAGAGRPLTGPAGLVSNGHAHRWPTHPVVGAHLLIGGRCDFISQSSRSPSQLRPIGSFVCPSFVPVWRSLGQVFVRGFT